MYARTIAASWRPTHVARRAARRRPLGLLRVLGRGRSVTGRCRSRSRHLADIRAHRGPVGRRHVPEPRSRISGGPAYCTRGCAPSCSAPRGSWPSIPSSPLPAVTPDLDALRRNRCGADGDLDRPLDPARPARRREFPHRSDLGRAHAVPSADWSACARYTPPGIAFEDLPPIDFVLISHDHYDHLDEPTVRRLARLFNPRFVVPLGIKAWLADRGITNAVELDWGESVTLKGLSIVCTPAQHGSRPHARRPGPTALGVVGGARIEALLLRRGHRLLPPLQGDRRRARAVRPGRAAHRLLHAAARSPGPSTSRPRRRCRPSTDLRAERFIGIHWGTFGLAREPIRRAAQAHRRRDRAARPRSRRDLGPATRRDQALVTGAEPGPRGPPARRSCRRAW